MVLAALAFGAVRASVNILEEGRWSVHPSERRIADFIRHEIGGAYTTDKGVDGQVIAVYLKGTNVTNQDLEVILELEMLQYIDVSNTSISDESLSRIVDHQMIEEVNAVGSQITRQGISDALRASGRQIYFQRK